MNVYTPQCIRAAEETLFTQGVSAEELMHRAGHACAEQIMAFADRFESGTITRFVVCCGAGRNGGDGLVCAHALHEADANVVIYRLKGAKCDALTQKMSKHCREIEMIEVPGLTDDLFKPGDFIVDALCATGFSGKMRAPLAESIQAITNTPCPVAAIDVPSGLDAGSGLASDVCVRADVTLVIGAYKHGLIYGDGPAYCGELRFCPIGLEEELLRHYPCDTVQLYTEEKARATLGRLDALTYKGALGRLLILAGSQRFSGAAALSSTAAMRSGAGMVYLMTSEKCRLNAVLSAVICDTLHADHEGFIDTPYEAVEPIAAGCDALLIGPGLGLTEAVRRLFETMLCAEDLPARWVMDASAITLFAESDLPCTLLKNKKAVFTPHAGEAAQLARKLKIAVPRDWNDTEQRLAFAAKLSKKLNSVVVLKGPRSICAAPDGRLSINGSGNAALATAGSGDVLSGILAARMLSCSDVFDAACSAVYIHGMCAQLSPLGMRATVADDLPDLLAPALRAISPFA